VFSDAAVEILSDLFQTLKGAEDEHILIRRSEALRRAINHLRMSKEYEEYAHPAVWAPLVFVGNGRY
jgi:CHAT domain-containing protein